MPTRKVGEVDWSKFRPCTNPDHDVPSMRVFQPGVYEHECPGCKNVIHFTVRPTHFAQSVPGRPSEINDRHVYYVDVGNMPTEDVASFMNEVQKKMIFIPKRG